MNWLLTNAKTVIWSVFAIVLFGAIWVETSPGGNAVVHAPTETKTETKTEKTVVPNKLPPTVTAYNGLLYAEMGPLVTALEKRGAKVTTLWHDEQGNDNRCPDYIIGHSMGGIAALNQGAKCVSARKPPKAIVTIDPTGYPGTFYCPKAVLCVNYYDPTHLVGFGARAVVGAQNHRVSGYSHLQIPSAPVVVNGVLEVVK